MSFCFQAISSLICCFLLHLSCLATSVTLPSCLSHSILVSLTLVLGIFRYASEMVLVLFWFTFFPYSSAISEDHLCRNMLLKKFTASWCGSGSVVLGC